MNIYFIIWVIIFYIIFSNGSSFNHLELFHLALGPFDIPLSSFCVSVCLTLNLPYYGGYKNSSGSSCQPQIISLTVMYSHYPLLRINIFESMKVLLVK